MEFFDIKAQYRRYKAEIDQRFAEVFEHGHFIMGPEIAELEKRLAAYTGSRHCITVGSGTQSLEIALRALEIGPGDEVITVPFTWISTAEVIPLVGAKPVFVDIEPVGFNLDPSQLEEAITSRTRAILPVGLFGQMPAMAEINAIAKAHGLPVIEDAAQSFGAEQSGIKSCAASLVGSTSFFPSKPLGCYGDGGALFTDDDDLARKMRAIRTHGGVQRHHHDLLGMNGRFDTLQAAVLLTKLSHLDEELVERNRLASAYTQALEDHCQTPKTLPGNTHVFAQYTIRVENRDPFAAELKRRGIPTAVYYPRCLHEQPVFRNLGYSWGRFPVAEKASREVLSLPMHAFLSESDRQQVITAVQESAVAHSMP